jgi:hypothetical protein
MLVDIHAGSPAKCNGIAFTPSVYNKHEATVKTSTLTLSFF